MFKHTQVVSLGKSVLWRNIASVCVLCLVNSILFLVFNDAKVKKPLRSEKSLFTLSKNFYIRMKMCRHSKDQKNWDILTL